MLIIDCRILKSGTGGAERFFASLAPDIVRNYPDKVFFLVSPRSKAIVARYIDLEHFISIPFEASNPIIRSLTGLIVAQIVKAKIKTKALIWYPFNTGYLNLGTRFRSIVTVHDTCVLDRPSYFSWPRRIIRKWQLKKTVTSVDLVIGISRYTVTQIGNNFSHLAINDIVYIPNAVTLPAKVKRRAISLPPFILFVGVLRRQKNIEFLLNCFKVLIEKYDYKGQLKLVGSGSSKKYLNHLIAVKNSMGLSERVQFCGYIEDDKLDEMYAQCDFMVFPSVYEGFGYPVLEAIGRGVPVVSSFSASLDEVAGSWAIKANPYDSADFSKNMNEAVLSKNNVAIPYSELEKYDPSCVAEKYCDIFRLISEGT